MKVLCKTVFNPFNNVALPGITKGIIYSVISTYTNYGKPFYFIRGDDNTYKYYPSIIFESIEEYRDSKIDKVLDNG